MEGRRTASEYDSSSGLLAKEFITVANSIKEAFGRTQFDDELQLDKAVAMYHKACKYHIQQALDDLLMWMNGRPAIGGYNRAQALMSDAKIVAAEALGVRLGKDSMKFIEQQAMAKANIGNNNGHKDEQGG